MILKLSTLDPDVNSVEEYLTNLDTKEFTLLLDIARSDLTQTSDDIIAELTALSINIYCSELEIEPEVIIEDVEMVNTLTKRFLTTVILFSLIQTDFIEKTSSEEMTLYKDPSFRSTKKGEIVFKSI